MDSLTVTKPVETYKEFNFEAAHALPPHSPMHGHSFKVCVHIVGDPDPVFGWPVSLYDLDNHIDVLRKQVDHKVLNEIEGLSVPSLENLAGWVWNRLKPEFPGLDRVVVSRGFEGQSEGCVYRG